MGIGKPSAGGFLAEAAARGAENVVGVRVGLDLGITFATPPSSETT